MSPEIGEQIKQNLTVLAPIKVVTTEWRRESQGFTLEVPEGHSDTGPQLPPL